MKGNNTPQKNVLGHPLTPCCLEPATGFHRDGYCCHSEQDLGDHTVCALMTEAFLGFSLTKGNNLISPRGEWGFPGLNPGDRWCLCAVRWYEAFKAGVAPPVYLQATHEYTLKTINIEDLKKHAIDLN